MMQLELNTEQSHGGEYPMEALICRTPCVYTIAALGGLLYGAFCIEMIFFLFVS